MKTMLVERPDFSNIKSGKRMIELFNTRNKPLAEDEVISATSVLKGSGYNKVLIKNMTTNPAWSNGIRRMIKEGGSAKLYKWKEIERA